MVRGRGLVGFAVDVATLDPRSGETGSVAIGPVVAPVGIVPVAGGTHAFFRASPELTDGDHQCFIEELAIA